MKHNNKYRYYEVSQDFINFLRKDAEYSTFGHVADSQVYSHYSQNHQINRHHDKYIGIIIEFQKDKYFAPLSHDGNRNWFNREESCDFELIYDSQGKYAGSILLCKALPLTDNLVRLLSLEKIFANEGYRYGMLCRNELDYLNSSLIHNKIQIKLQECIYGQHSSSKPLRVDYSLIIKNVAIYNAYKLEQATQKIEILKSEIEDIRNSSLKNNEKRK